MRRTAYFVTAVVVFIFLLAPDAAAVTGGIEGAGTVQPSGDGGASATAEISFVSPGAPADGGTGTVSGSEPSETSVVAVVTAALVDCIDGEVVDYLVVPTQNDAGEFVWPEGYESGYRTYVLAGGEVVTSRTGCGSPPPPLPPAPSAAEVWAGISVDAAEIGRMPSAPPITGLETLFWAVGSGTEPFSIDVEVRGWTARTTVSPTKWIWYPGDGARIGSSRPGTPCATRKTCNPSARHTYERKGDYELQLDTVWSGEFTLAYQRDGYNIVLDAQNLGSITASQNMPVHVIEVRGVLVP